MEFMAKGDKKLKAFSLFGNKKEEALELYQKGAVSAPFAAAAADIIIIVVVVIMIKSNPCLTICFRLQICFKQAKKWQEAGDAYVKNCS